MRTVVATLLVLLAVPTAVADAKGFRGKTAQGRMASIMVSSDGYVKRIRISYSAPCGDAARFANVMRLEAPFDSSTPDRVTERAVLINRPEGGPTSRQSVTVTARRRIDARGKQSWSGTFRTRVVILSKDDTPAQTCELKRVRWSAR